MTKMNPVLISLKPQYSDLVFKGLKTAELRRKLSGKLKNRDVYVYTSSPVKSLRGGFRVGEIWEGTPNTIWEMVSNLAGVDRETFDQYYQGSKIAYALEIKKVWEYKDPISLEDLRCIFDNFVVPQSYRYLTDTESLKLKSLDLNWNSIVCA